jgi:DNA-binding transcriptional LysR family regulator
MEWQQLTHFRTIARVQHLGRASAELGVSQPALSRTIARLETEFGTPLFDRKGRSIVLNLYGRALLARVERILQELDDAHKELTDLFNNQSGTVALAFLASFGTWLVPELMRTFRTEHENANFRLLQGPAPTLRERLLAGDVDLCLVSPRFEDPTLEWLPIGEEELFLLVPAEHPVATRQTIRLQEVAEERFISLKSGYGLRRVTDELCTRAGFTPDISFEGEEVATLWGLVGAGLGIALAPSQAGAVAGSPVAVRVSAPRCFRTIGLAWVKKRYMSSASRTFLDFVRARHKRTAHLNASPHTPPVLVRGRMPLRVSKEQ